MLQDALQAPGCSRMLCRPPDALGCSVGPRMLWDALQTLGCFGMFQDALGCYGMLCRPWDALQAPGCFGILCRPRQVIKPFLGHYPGFPGFFGFFEVLVSAPLTPVLTPCFRFLCECQGTESNRLCSPCKAAFSPSSLDSKNKPFTCLSRFLPLG